MRKNGFSKVELLVAVSILSSLSIAATGGFYYVIPKAQATDASKVIMAKQVEMAQNMDRGLCTSDGQPQTFRGKYGRLTVSGTPVIKTNENCPSGCKLIYTFELDGVNKAVAGKTVVVDLLQNKKLSLVESTIPERFNPFSAHLSSVIGTSCPNQQFTIPTITQSDVTGVEQGDVDPTAPPTGGGTTPPPVDPAPPTGGGSGTTPPVEPAPPTGGGSGTTPPPVEPAPPAVESGGTQSVISSKFVNIYQYLWEEVVGAFGEYEVDMLGYSTQKSSNTPFIMSTYTADILKRDLNVKSQPSGVVTTGEAGIDADKLTLNGATFTVLDIFVYDVSRLTPFAEDSYITSVGYSVRIQGASLPPSIQVRVANGSNKANWQTATKYSQNGTTGHYIASQQAATEAQRKTLVSNFLGSAFVGRDYNFYALGKGFSFEVKQN